MQDNPVLKNIVTLSKVFPAFATEPYLPSSESITIRSPRESSRKPIFMSRSKNKYYISSREGLWYSRKSSIDRLSYFLDGPLGKCWAPIAPGLCICGAVLPAIPATTSTASPQE